VNETLAAAARSAGIEAPIPAITQRTGTAVRRT
jgi:hypothetical protein